jgi:hypothetical protein
MKCIRDSLPSLAARLALGALLLNPLTALHGANLKLSSPLDYQVIQRASKANGGIRIAGQLTEADAKSAVVEARMVVDGKSGEWRRFSAAFAGATVQTTMEAPSGGWYRLEVRVLEGDKVLADAIVEHVGVGEVFVVAGQSNSANHGAERQSPKTGRVTAFDGQRWRLAADPQPGASGGSGSFLPPFGDAMAERMRVPVGLLACGIGATSVREWLPKGARFPNPPTILDRVRQSPEGAWESRGQAFALFTARMKQLGPHGFRAVLWHQGESDANQTDPTRTLPGKLYRQYLEQLIRDSNRELGWDAPWFVAQASYHVPGDEASPEIRAAQQSLWTDGVANEGPDTDQLKGDFRDEGGQGVHFSGKGLREHAARWAAKVAPWVEQNLK